MGEAEANVDSAVLDSLSKSIRLYVLVNDAFSRNQRGLGGLGSFATIDSAFSAC